MLPIILSPMWHSLAIAPLPLRFPTVEPGAHLLARLLAPDVHSRNHATPVKREREARELEERAVLGVGHAVHLQCRARVPHRAQLRVRERAGLRARYYRRYGRQCVAPHRRGESVGHVSG